MPATGGGPSSSEPAGEWLTIDGVSYRSVVLCFLFRPVDGTKQVLLGLKRTGFGTGRVMALGGKIDGGETAIGAAVREVSEESGIVLPPEELQDAGRIRWSFPSAPEWNMAAFLFTADAGNADAVPSLEIEPCWYGLDDIPWDAMWKDAPYWLPTLLAGRRVEACIAMDTDNENVAGARVD
jgi:8-oxo-dGTP diphosphatase